VKQRLFFVSLSTIVGAIAFVWLTTSAWHTQPAERPKPPTSTSAITSSAMNDVLSIAVATSLALTVFGALGGMRWWGPRTERLIAGPVWSSGGSPAMNLATVSTVASVGIAAFTTSTLANPFMTQGEYAALAGLLALALAASAALAALLQQTDGGKPSGVVSAGVFVFAALFTISGVVGQLSTLVLRAIEANRAHVLSPGAAVGALAVLGTVATALCAYVVKSICAVVADGAGDSLGVDRARLL
jgi:hypothetical protein